MSQAAPPPAGQPDAERRRHERRRVRTQARMELVGYVADGTLMDVSRGGVRFRTEDAHLRAEPGNFVYVHFDVEDDDGRRGLRKSVQLRWLEEDGDARVFGLEFDEELELVDAVA